MLLVSKVSLFPKFLTAESKSDPSESAGDASNEQVGQAENKEVNLDEDVVDASRPCCSMAPSTYGNYFWYFKRVWSIYLRQWSRTI